MWKHLYGILAAVLLCMWKAEKTDAGIPRIVSFLFLYHDSEYLYNLFNNQPSEQMWRNAKAYAEEHPHPLVGSDYIMRQHIYLSSMNREMFSQNILALRSAIMLNSFLTIRAYEAAVVFRVCAFFYGYVNLDWTKHETCWNLSSYMEWYFSFMLEKKVEDLCTIKKYFVEKPKKTVNAEYVCKLLGKLNLDFLRLPREQRSIHLLRDDENSIYKSDKLRLYDVDTDTWSFLSRFEQYKIPKKNENEHPDGYYKRVQDEIWSFIRQAYTKKFYELESYFVEITSEKHFDVSAEPRLVPIQYDYMEIISDKMSELRKIMDLPTNAQRNVVYEGNIQSNIGSEIYRSNAVEILRQLVYYVMSSVVINAGLQVDLHRKMTIINSGNLKCQLRVAPKNLYVDYCFEIDIRGDTLPNLPLLDKFFSLPIPH